MANFNAGIALMILSCYMFAVFTIIYSVNSISVDYGLGDPSASQSDLGFTISLGCSGSGTPYCFNTGDAWFEEGCNMIPGCYWINSSCIDEGCCKGMVLNHSKEFNCKIQSPALNLSVCERVGCTWISKKNMSIEDNVNPQKSTNTKGVINTFKIMYGFNPSVTDPSLAYGLFSFFAIWIPTALMIFCIYMLLPFITG
jgi:hypothetical protein